MKDKTLCIWPLCERKAVHDELCIRHKMYSKKDLVKKGPEKIQQLSDKRKDIQKEYVKIVKEMLNENPYCEIRVEGCQGKATGAHHQKKRTPATILDRRFLIRACNWCQKWCELHPLEAIDKGFSVSKFQKAV